MSSGTHVLELHVAKGDHNLEDTVMPPEPDRRDVRASVLAVGHQHTGRWTSSNERTSSIHSSATVPTDNALKRHSRTLAQASMISSQRTRWRRRSACAA